MSDEYTHSGFCSGSERHPRTPGNTCSCHSCDLWGNRLSILRHDASAKRTIWVATCLGCHKRTEFPFTSEPIPKETFCRDCSNGIMKCSWEGCGVADPDMLSIDHINDDGAKDRGKSTRGGQGLYCLLKRQKFPDGFQTLCYNHQSKKEILRRREQRYSRYADIQIKEENERGKEGRQAASV